MVPHKHIKTIADIIQDQQARYNRLDDKTAPAFDTTTENDQEWDEKYSPGQARQGLDNPTKK
jgi:hypothetical protein